jgi:hypothetical protein
MREPLMRALALDIPLRVDAEFSPTWEQLQEKTVTQPSTQNRIYRVVTSAELMEATREGWQIEAREREQRVIEVRDQQGRRPTEEERAHGHYNTVYNHKHFFGDIVIFIVWKEAEQLDTEKRLRKELWDAQHEVARLRCEYDGQHETIKKLQIDVTTAGERLQRQVDKVQTAEDKNHKLEADIAKLRQAIGDLRMREILGGK